MSESLTETLQEFEDEMSDISVPSDKIEEMKEEMQKEFDNIIDEVCRQTSLSKQCNILKLKHWFGGNGVMQAQEELETEGLKGEFDRTQATQALETTLDKLLDRLEEKDEQEPEQQTTESQRASSSHRNSHNLGPKQPGKQTTIAAHTVSTTAILIHL